MNRRLFVQTGVSSLFIPNAMIAAPASAPSRDGFAWDYFFFDERFAAARRLAGELSGTTEPTPVDGDVTGIWTGELGRASLTTAMTLKGVTTDSFYFCLKILLADQSKVEAQVSRIDQDLYLWTIRTDNHFKKAAMSWQNHSHLV
jgi:DICT domain-containing protein